MIRHFLQLVTLRAHIRELDVEATEGYAIRTLARARRRAADLERRITTEAA